MNAQPNFVDAACRRAQDAVGQSIAHPAAWPRYAEPEEESWGRPASKGLVDRLAARVTQLEQDAVRVQERVEWLEREFKRLATKVGRMEGADEERFTAVEGGPEEYVPVLA